MYEVELELEAWVKLAIKGSKPTEECESWVAEPLLEAADCDLSGGCRKNASPGENNLVRGMGAAITCTESKSPNVPLVKTGGANGELAKLEANWEPEGRYPDDKKIPSHRLTVTGAGLDLLVGTKQTMSLPLPDRLGRSDAVSNPGSSSKSVSDSASCSVCTSTWSGSAGGRENPRLHLPHHLTLKRVKSSIQIIIAGPKSQGKYRSKIQSRTSQYRSRAVKRI